MNESIEIQCTYTPDDLIDAWKIHTRSQGETPFSYLKGMFFIVIFAIALGPIALDREGWLPGVKPWIYLSIVGFLLIIICLIVWIVQKVSFKVIRRQFENSPTNNQTVHWTFDDAGFRSWTSMTKDAVRWGVVGKIIEAPVGFLVYLGENDYVLILNRSFTSLETRQAFVAIVKHHVPNYIVLDERFKTIESGSPDLDDL